MKEATEVEPQVEHREQAASESSCCAVQSQVRARPWLIGGAVLALPLQEVRRMLDAASPATR